MCAIGGFIDKNNILNDSEKKVIGKLFVDSMSHRGGDGFGVVVHNNVTLSHNRLSIVDSSEESSQPISNNFGILSYNGEIYNYKDLSNKKEKSDTIFLVNYLAEYKDISKLDGMFAYSFLDKRKNTLTIQVDRFGIKPLYYYEDDNFFAWSSEIKAFKNLPDINFIFNHKALQEFLVFRSLASSETLIKDVYKLLPGEQINYDISNNKKQAGIKIDFIDTVSKLKISYSQEEIFYLVENSIKINLISDVPIGVQLSGGIDSTVITAISSEYIKNINTYSIGMEDDSWNEFKYSDTVSEKFKTNHSKILFSKKDFIENFIKLTYQLDEPIVHANTVPMYLLSKEARKNVKVLITGEGADELLGGYNRYSKLNKKEYFNAFNDMGITNKILLSPEIKNTRSYIFNKYKFKNILKKYSMYDIKTYLPTVLLRQDKSSMLGNVESRVPFLSNDLSVLLFNLPNELKYGDYGQKEILKSYLKTKHNFEDSFLKREKCGFGLPIKEWLFDEEVFLPILKRLSEHFLMRKYFNISEIENIIAKHRSEKEDYTSILFTLISLIIWYDIFINKED